MSKLKLTGFARFIIFLLIVSPLVYFGMQYLQNSGTLDKVKEKVENTQADRNAEMEVESSSDILKEIDRQSGNQTNKEQEAVIAEQRRKIEALEQQNRELKNKNGSSSNSSTPPLTNKETTLPPPTSTNNDNSAPSIDDLIRGAENSSGRTTSPDLDTPSSTKSLASWTFSFSNINGIIEFYQQGNLLMSRATYEGMDRVDVFELRQKDDRYYVLDSPSDEYYVLREDGNLDAYDSSGFQTRCTRQR